MKGLLIKNRITMKLLVITLCIVFVCSIDLLAHSGFIQHGEDIMAVLGLEHDTRLFNRSKDTKSNNSWVKFISSDMIDNTDFHKELEKDYPGFSIKGPNRHRLLFHWAYDTEPWNEELEVLFREYCDITDRNIESNIRILKAKIISEQKKRNRKVMNKTQEVFGFETGGKQGHVYTHFFASMAYNIHILGDYTSDNTVLDGLFGFDRLIGKIVSELRNLDYSNSKYIVSEITRINSQNIDVQKKADMLMDYLKQEVPGFIKKACNGSVKRKIEGQGFRLIETSVHKSI